MPFWKRTVKETKDQIQIHRHQFSKKMASRTEWFWFIYMLILVALIAYQPDVSMISVYLGLIVTIVMITSVLAYTRNSVFEKSLNAAKEMAQIKFKWKHNGTELVTPDNVVEIEDEEATDEEPEEYNEEDLDEDSDEDLDEEGGNG